MTNKLFIGGLRFGTTESVLKEELDKYGLIEKIRLIHNNETGESRGFAFVTYSTPSEAQKAVDALDNQQFDGRLIGVKPAVDKKR